MPYIGNTPALDYISYAVQNFTVTAGTTSYALDYSVANENDIRLVINNVIQRPGVSYAYSATGTTLTLTSATLATDTMYAVFIGRAVQTVTPAANSITNTMLTPSVITGQTAETSVAGGDSVLIYDDSASALRKMTRTNFVAGVGGVNTPAFFAYKTSAQTVTNDVDTLISFQTEVFDTANCYDNSSTYRFTPTTAGKYFVFTSLCSNGTGANSVRDFAIRLYFNGAFLNYTTIFSNYPNQTGKEQSGFFSTIQTFNGTSDYIAIYGRVTGTGSPLAIESGYPSSTSQNVFFGAYKLIE